MSVALPVYLSPAPSHHQHQHLSNSPWNSTPHAPTDSACPLLPCRPSRSCLKPCASSLSPASSITKPRKNVHTPRTLEPTICTNPPPLPPSPKKKGNDRPLLCSNRTTSHQLTKYRIPSSCDSATFLLDSRSPRTLCSARVVVCFPWRAVRSCSARAREWGGRRWLPPTAPATATHGHAAAEATTMPQRPVVISSPLSSFGSSSLFFRTRPL